MYIRCLAVMLAVAVSLAARSLSSASETDAQSTAFFENQIRPLLVRRCLRCHGGEKTRRGLRVDSRQALVNGGKSGAAVLPGRPDDSLLIQAVRYVQGGPQMPPSGKLAGDEIELLARWVKAGAPWPTSRPAHPLPDGGAHWSFVPLRHVVPPADGTGWATMEQWTSMIPEEAARVETYRKSLPQRSDH